MSTQFPQDVGYVTKTASITAQLVVNREFDFCRLEETLCVSTSIGNRSYRRQVRFYQDEYTTEEMVRLARCLGDMIRREIADA